MITAIDKKTALVLIDLQNGIVKGKTIHPVKEVLAKAAALVEAFHREKLPVIIVNVNAAGAAWTRARVDQPMTVPSEPETWGDQGAKTPTDPTAIVPDIPTHPDDIFITKKTWNAFFNTPLHEKLQELGITGIVLGGIATSLGVEGTARAASELGYNITFATDAMTDRQLAAHENSTTRIFPFIGESGITKEVIAKLQE